MAHYTNCSPIVHEGTIYLRRKGALKKNKSYHAVLHAASMSGVARLELYENQKHSLSLEPTFRVVGADVVKVEKIMLPDKEMRHAFLISTRDQSYTFFDETHFKCDHWVRNIQETLLEDITARKTTSSKSEIAVSHSHANEIYESVDNFYCQTSEFLVKPDGVTRAKMSVSGDVKLVVEDDSISIISTSHKLIVRWKLKEIRKFSITNEDFSLEAGRKSSLGEGNFVFLTAQGESINALICAKKNLLKEKKEETNRHPGWKTLPPPAQHRPTIVEAELNSEEIYDVLEEVLPPSSAKHRSPYVDKTLSQHMSPSKPASRCWPAKPTKNGSSITASKGIPPPPINNQSNKKITNQKIIHEPQTEIYAEPQMIVEAWKSYACDDVDDSETYSTLDFSDKKVEDHYWHENTAMPYVEAQKREEIQDEDIYATVDLSKKHRK